MQIKYYIYSEVKSSKSNAVKLLCKLLNEKHNFKRFSVNKDGHLEDCISSERIQNLADDSFSKKFSAKIYSVNYPLVNFLSKGINSKLYNAKGDLCKIKLEKKWSDLSKFSKDKKGYFTSQDYINKLQELFIDQFSKQMLYRMLVEEIKREGFEIVIINGTSDNKEPQFFSEWGYKTIKVSLSGSTSVYYDKIVRLIEC